MALLGASSAFGADGADLELTVTTDRPSYLLDTPVEITVSKCNPTQEPITVTHACPCCHFDLSILDEDGLEVADFSAGCIQIVYDITWQPGECTTETFPWLQVAGPFGPDGGPAGPPVGAGVYSVLYHWRPGPFTTDAVSEPFRIDSWSVPTLSGVGAVLLACVLGTVAVLRLKRRRGSAC